MPLHIDEEAAARSIFGGLSASSAQIFSIFVLLTTKLQDRFHVLAGMGWDELRLLNAVRPGDAFDLETTVLEKRESKSKPDRGIVPDQTHLRNQRRETVLQCIGNVLVAKRPNAEAKTLSVLWLPSKVPSLAKLAQRIDESYSCHGSKCEEIRVSKSPPQRPLSGPQSGVSRHP
jgi:acyl dehydratase